MTKVALLFGVILFNSYLVSAQTNCANSYFNYEDRGISSLSFEYSSQYLQSHSDNLLAAGLITQNQSDSLKLIRFIFEMNSDKDGIEVKLNHSIDLPVEYVAIVSAMEHMLKGFSELWAFMVQKEGALDPTEPNNQLVTGETIEFDQECLIASISTETEKIIPSFVETDEGFVVAKIDYSSGSSSINSGIEYALSNSVYYPTKLILVTEINGQKYTFMFTIDGFRTNF